MADPGVDGESLIRLARDALAEWNLDGARLWPHSHRENAVFRVEDVDGGIYALRIHRDGYHDLKALESEQRWCQDLAATGLSIPTSLKTRDGRAYATLSLPDSDQSRHVGLVEWIPSPRSERIFLRGVRFLTPTSRLWDGNFSLPIVVQESGRKP